MHVRHILFSTVQVSDHGVIHLSAKKKHLNDAYHSALRHQEYLNRQELKITLARALREFKNLIEVTIEDRNGQIGFRQLTKDFGTFKAADLLTCNGTDTFLPLLQGLSEAGTQLSILTIGTLDNPSSCSSCKDTPNIFSANGSEPSYPSPLCSDVMFTAFCDPRNTVQKVLSQLKWLEISGLRVDHNDESGFRNMKKAIENLTKSARELVSVDVEAISRCDSDFNLNYDVPNLSLADIFHPRINCDNLEYVILTGFLIRDHRTEMAFIRSCAESLRKVEFVNVGLYEIK